MLRNRAMIYVLWDTPARRAEMASMTVNRLRLGQRADSGDGQRPERAVDALGGRNAGGVVGVPDPKSPADPRGCKRALGEL